MKLLTAFLLISCLTLANYQLYSQDAKLKQLALENDSLEQVKRQRVLAYSLKTNTPRLFNRNGVHYIISDVTPMGIPVFEKTDNAGASKTVGVDQLRTGGSLGLNLTGTDFRVGVWDGGRVKADHVELIGRVTGNDGASTISNHATHVTGTIMATGINTLARGMASDARALSYDFDNDVSEMISVSKADQTTLLISNHSYGTVSGWEWNGSSWDWNGDPSISATEDYKFGFYDSRARSWDNLCFSSPYYTIVKSAGNDRTDVGDGSKPADNDFNSISTYGNAKNIITVGAVNKIATAYSGPASVVMSSFSSWGPTDDGRIKPDISAPGVNIFSTTSTTTTSYGNLSGTSMATPVVSGTLTLLQQLHFQLNQSYMRAATLKALIIHTAKEAGAQPGPDYRFGWGLLDAEAAAKVILTRDDVNTRIIESTLSNNQTFQVELMPAENQKITATLVWTDPAGTPTAPSLNPSTRMLVNDLDMKIVDDNGNQQLPWVLNPGSPNAAATRGDNVRDNVEKIEFASPQPVKYYLRISHKNSLVNDFQNFSLILTYTSADDQHVTYYWVGGSGNWNSPDHWSLTSGGPSAGTVPSADDRVIIDENSSASNGQTLSLTAPASCYSLYWLTSKTFNLNLNNEILSVHENVLITSSSLNISSAGTLNLKGEDKQYSFNSSQPDLHNLTIHFNGSLSTWKFIKDIQVHALEIESGTVDLTNLTIQSGAITDIGNGAKELILNGTTLVQNQPLDINLTNGTILSSNSASLLKTSGYDLDLSLANQSFNGQIVFSDSEINVHQANSVGRIFGKGTINILGNTTISALNLEAGSSVVVQSGQTLNLTSSVTLESADNDPITIESSGGPNGAISIAGNYRVCEDNLVITNVDFTGTSVFAVGNSVVTNSSGWLQTTCDNLLFADFTYRYNCEGSYLYLSNKSLGSPETIKWFINGVEFSGASIYYKITNTEDILVRLEITKGGVMEVYETEIPVIANTMSTNYLVRSEDRLYSFAQSSAYQWLLDGEVIPGEVQRFTVYTGNSGSYSVLTFNESCNRESDPFVVTSVEPASNNRSLMLYPNPAENWTYFSTGETVSAVYAYDMLGKLRPLNFNRLNDRYEINLASLAEGMYILRIYSINNQLIGQTKILKQ